MNSSAVVTIVTANRYHMAKSLMASMVDNHVSADLFACVMGGNETARLPPSSDFRIIGIECLNIPDLKKQLFSHTSHEMCCMAKPFAMKKLLEMGYDKVLYFDADICVYDSLACILDKLEQYDGLVTPHILQTLDDGLLPDDLTILRAGTFNAGFLALKSSSRTNDYLKWFCAKVLTHCFRDSHMGFVSTDQKWLNLVPTLFPFFHIDLSSGMNVAYWNLPHRCITQTDGNYVVDGVPLVFFHFSGLIPDQPGVLSKFDDRFRGENLPSPISRMVSDYICRLEGSGLGDFNDLSYEFDYYSNSDVYITPAVRRIYRENSFVQQVFGDDPFDLNRDPGFVRTYNKRSLDPNNPVTLLSEEVWSERRDLQLLFPEIGARDSLPYSTWFVINARDLGIPSAYTDQIDADLMAGSRPYVSHITCRLVELLAKVAQVILRAPQKAKTLIPHEKLSDAQSAGVFGVGYSELVTRLIKIARRMVETERGRRVSRWIMRKSSAAYRANLNYSLSLQRPPSSGGINIIGRFGEEFGSDESVRLSIQAVTAAGIPMNVITLDGSVAYGMNGEGSRFQENKEIVNSSTNLIHLGSADLPVAYVSLGPRFLASKYNIGYWMLGTQESSESLKVGAEYLDEIWTASSLCQDVISRMVSVPVIRIPYGVAPQVPEGVDRRYLGLPEEGFLFLHIGDRYGVPEQENPLGVLEAFSCEFSEESGVYLVLQAMYAEHRPDIMEQILEMKTRNHCIILIDRYLSRLETKALINVCNCYVSLHRVESFGLPIAEAMSLGKPAIATGWSGNMDFMTLTNSLPVDFRMVETEDCTGLLSSGGQWAEPCLHHASQLMRRVVDDPDLCFALGQQAMADIKANFSPQKSGRLMRDRLNILDSRAGRRSQSALP